ncbi:MAG: flavodoxin family protein [Candidatus Saganbacteria bacterium]|nr:flavodoxin family protein [Candidatus Saganbacteria bacterium]
MSRINVRYVTIKRAIAATTPRFLKVVPKEIKVQIGLEQFGNLALHAVQSSENYFCQHKLSRANSLAGHAIVVADSVGGEADSLVSGITQNSIVARTQTDLFQSLFRLYKQQVRPSLIVFNATSPHTNVGVFMREIYSRPHYHFLRTIPMLAINFPKNSSFIPEPIRVFAANCSPHKKGNTFGLLSEQIERYFSGPYFDSEIVHLRDIKECQGCGGHQQSCQDPCVIDDELQDMIPKILQSDIFLVGSPVHLDGPTARARALLSRISGQTHHNRFAFIGKTGIPVASAWCSGTKTTIQSLADSLEMLGFNILGRSTMENISLWSDNKTRGGVPYDWFWPA